MSINRWLGKETVVHINNVILLSHKKEQIQVSSNEVDESKAYYTKLSKSEREQQILYTDTYMQNLERWYWWNYLQGSNGDTDIENRFMDMAGGEKRECGIYGENNKETYITICKIDSQWVFGYVCLRELKPGPFNNLEGLDEEGGGRKVQEGMNICLPIADSCWCLSESNTRL